MGIPASARARNAALMLALRVPPSACKTWMYTSICVRGMSSSRIVCSSAFLITMEISVARRSDLPRRRRSPVLNAAMLYSHLTIALSGSIIDRCSTSLGPKTLHITWGRWKRSAMVRGGTD